MTSQGRDSSEAVAWVSWEILHLLLPFLFLGPPSQTELVQLRTC